MATHDDLGTNAVTQMRRPALCRHAGNRWLFPRLVDALYRRGLLKQRASTPVVIDAPLTTISIVFRNDRTVNTTFFEGLDTGNGDLWEAALLLDGAISRTCDWRRIDGVRADRVEACKISMHSTH